MKYTMGQKVRFKFGEYETRVGEIIAIKVGIFNIRYTVIVEYPMEAVDESSKCFYDILEKEIIEVVPLNYKGWC